MTEIIKIKIEGLNFSRIVNALIDEGVLIKNLKQKTKSAVFDIKKSQETRLKSVCNRFHKKYIILSENTFINYLKKARYYLGFIFAAILSMIFVFVFNMYIYKVNVSVDKNMNLNLESVKTLLNDNNVVGGMKKSDVDILKIQNMIIASRNDISGCKVEQKGGVLDIVIYPGKLKEDVNKDDIYSKHNAVITNIEVFAGSSNLKIGDVVKAGDLLIKNNNGAAGRIKGKIYYFDYLIYNENQIVKQKTGNVFECSNIMFFNKTTNKRNKNLNFSNYFEENCVFPISKNLFFPINLIKTKYIEFELVEQLVEFEKVEEELKNELYLKVLQQIDGCNEDLITGVTYSVVKENNLTRLDCFIECEVDLI